MKHDSEQGERIKELCDQAFELDPRERAAFLDEACAGDDELRREVESLLSHEESVEGFLAQPAWQPVVRDMAEEQRDLIAGRQLGRYKVHEWIGGGGMGEVWRATDEQLNRDVAIKILPPEFSADAERVRRFGQEAFAASRLNHPNIITIFEIVHAEGAHFIAEEYVEGQTLREMLTDPQMKQPRKLDIEKSLEIAIQVASALKAAHTAWIIHRDIKPENVMVRNDGLVKVLDFGIAKLSEEEFATPPSGGSICERSTPPEGSAMNSTVPGTVLGTASYMSPEQARGEQLDGRSDLFSLGVVLFEMVAGERLFTGVTRAAALRAFQSDEELVPPNVGVGKIPNELYRIIRRMLRRNRDERYATAGEVLDDLNRVKRQLENRTARRIVGLSALVGVAAVALASVAAFLSVSEVWEERVLRDGHTAAVRQAVFSPDGRLLISVGEDKRVIVWDFARRERLATLDGHQEIILAVAFAPNGKWFATMSNNGAVIVWDAAQRTKIAEWRDHQSGTESGLAFSPDGRLLVSYGRDGDVGFTVVRETGRWQRVRELRQIGYHNFVFSPNGQQLMDCSGRVFELETGRLAANLHAEEMVFNRIALAPDATRLAGVDGAGLVSFFQLTRPGDLRRTQRLHRERAHHDHGRAVAFSPNGQLIASGAEHIVLWNTLTLKREAVLEHTSIVWHLAFSPDGHWLVSTHGDGSILIWDVGARARAANLNEHSSPVRAVTFAGDGKRIASASDDHSIIIWNMRIERKEAVLVGHETRINGVAVSRDSQWLAAADQDKTTILWDVTRQQSQWNVTDSGAPGYCVALSPDGRWVAATAGVYERTTGQQVVDLYQPPDPTWAYGSVYGVAFSTDGRRLACVTDGGWLLVWDAGKWQLLARQKVSGFAQISVSFAPDGQALVTGDDEGVVRLWRVEPLEQLAVVGRHAARIKSVVFSPDGKEAASAGDDQSICLWDVGSRKLITRIGTHNAPVLAVAFSPDGKQLISGGHDHSVRLYTRHRMLWGWRWD